jgi:hypothetical protein
MRDRVLDIDLTYAHSYEVEELRENPGTGSLDVPLFYIPRPEGRLEHDGLWLKFSAASGKSWAGVFEFGYTSPPAFSRVVSTPDANRACVIAKGKGFLVTVEDPEQWEEVQVLPVLDLRSIAEHNMLVFSDLTRLAAYDKTGLVWRSPRVCWDELRIVKVTRDTIEGIGYDPTTLSESCFSVDMKTGRSLLPSPASKGGRPLW